MRENTEGDYVLYSDYAELAKEIDRLREFEWMYKDLCK